MLTRAELLSRIATDDALSRLYAWARERIDDDPGHDLSHCLRVALWAIELGDDVDWREAVAAALLHDIVNVPKDHPDRHRASELCADVASAELPAFGFGDAAIARITEAIRDHSYSRGATPGSPLGQALQDADRLEALGVIGLFRCLSTGVRMGARYFDDADPFGEQRALDDKRYSIDHFATKLLGLPKTMCTERGREEAERRADILREVLTRLSAELGVPIVEASRVRP